ncbi:HYC_CC_PP family protein [Ancylomarina sp. YFZ004]
MLKKISHIILALLVLVTTMGMTVSAHSCSGELKSIQLLSEAENCCGDSCPNCQNDIIKVEIEDDFTIQTLNFDFEQEFTFLAAFIQLLIVPSITEEIVQVAYHKPPPLKIQTVLSDLQVYRL